MKTPNFIYVMIPDDFYREQESLFKFASTFATGAVLDYSSTSLMSYISAKALLAKNCSKIFHHNVFDTDDDFSYRQKIDNIIDFKRVNFSNKHAFFDCIISTDTIHLEKNPFNTISKFHDLLKDDGILIISSFNPSALSHIYEKSKILSDPLPKEKFLEILSTKFSKIEFYSHILFSQEKSNQSLLNSCKNRIRFVLGNILNKIDKKGTIYRIILVKYLKPIDKSFNVQLDEHFYLPKLYHEKDCPKYFVALCRKN